MVLSVLGMILAVSSKQGNYSEEEICQTPHMPEYQQFTSEREETYPMGIVIIKVKV